MTDIRIAYMNYDNFLQRETCHVVIPMDESLESIGLDAVIQRSVPEGKDYIITSESDLPQSREHRDRWVIADGKVVVSEE